MKISDEYADLEKAVLNRRNLIEGLELAICQPEEVHVSIHIEDCNSNKSTSLNVCTPIDICNLLDIAISEFNEQIYDAEEMVKEYAKKLSDTSDDEY